ncbi:aspartate aminotransferase family protein [Clostridium aminobutyricum]|uniref:Aminotransferase class III-fold pyridoxal phosphate-dependent enzyme n=1 Tax=Clostridium aminobutyricum TaxID=33953 RepID=A0A939IHL9_CLOAM|nr:aminotransferase class III-fold pyridoxal phosphate-dependent enzyme [Clostridium aminobutyricum]MBN7773952.1 aminotransferase class III-fold pyridoxal phosphate-dependent enzyme [Clostridium aminobutyricum]
MSDNNKVLNADFFRDYPRINHGKGIYMYSEEGEEIIDGASGPVLVSLGHGIEEIADAMREQAVKLAFAHRDDCVTSILEESCENFYEASEGDMVKTFQVAGGSEANEIAIKLARNYHLVRGNAGKYKVISRWQSYHGSSMGVLSLSGFTKRRKGYEPYLFEHGHIAPCYCYRCWFDQQPESCGLQCAKALENEILAQGPETVSAFIAEPISGMSLCVAEPHSDYFKEIRRICDKYDVLLIMDEVMTGFGRTGKMFAYKHFGIIPDMVSTGKAVSGGYFPLAAVSVTEKVYKGLYDNHGDFTPGYSWSGNPLGAAVQVASYKYLNEHNLVKNCEEMGAYLKEKITEMCEKHPTVGDIRGRGLMVGIELVKDKKTKECFDPSVKYAAQMNAEAINQNMIIESSSGCNRGQSGDALVLSPAFIITKEEVDKIVDRLDRVITNVEERNGFKLEIKCELRLA